MSSFSEAIDAGKKIIDAIANADDKVALFNVLDRAQELSFENEKLRNENLHLKAELAKKKAVEIKDGAYYLLNDDGGLTGPICPNCYKEDIVMLLYQTEDGAKCSRCRTEYVGVASNVPRHRQTIW